jgi:hypothetical protein
MEQVQKTSYVGSEAAVLVAIELSKANWLLAVHDPAMGKVSQSGVRGGDAEALNGLVERYRRAAEARGGTSWDRVRVRGGLRWVLAPAPVGAGGDRLLRDGPGESEGGPQGAQGKNRPGGRREPVASVAGLAPG